jgi:2-keto-4-pentenoate hydratase/2-oxohepta-3-ene-1,7-dioic acid hydratase in catechol pathway
MGQPSWLDEVPIVKLLTYDPGSGPRAGVLMDSTILDASALLGTSSTLRDVRAVLELPGAPLDRLRASLAEPCAAGVRLDQVRLRPPVLQPPTVRDFMAYEGHATFYSNQLPEVWYRLPIFYFSNPLRIFGPNDEVPFPSASNRLDYELELGCVIGKEGSNVLAADGLDYIAGFLIFNDWSARDLQFDEMECRLGPAKGKDPATSLGPWLVTTDELLPYLRNGRLDLRCSLRVNGQTWMDSRSHEMQFGWGDFVERASRDSRIVPGDVFGSGTVSGGTVGEAIGHGFPARYLEPGDVVELDVEHLGVLRNRLGPKAELESGYRFGAPRQAPVG